MRIVSLLPADVAALPALTRARVDSSQPSRPPFPRPPE